MGNKSFLLSIIIVTMNREQELGRALNSCLAAKLPAQTEFIIVDNASTDNTEIVVRNTLKNVAFNYLKLQKNVGCAPARNIGFEKANGKYLYFMDDDLYIPNDISGCFFADMIGCLEKDPCLSILTNNIYDETYLMDLKLIRKKQNADQLSDSYVYHGGSHFIRKEDFTAPLYPEIPFGVEELVLSLKLHDRRKSIVCNNRFTVVHCPKYKAYDRNDSSYNNRLICAIGNSYAIKRKMFPIFCLPIIWIIYTLRKKKFGLNFNDKQKVNEQISIIEKSLPNKRISNRTMISLLKNFGLRIFI